MVINLGFPVDLTHANRNVIYNAFRAQVSGNPYRGLARRIMVVLFSSIYWSIGVQLANNLKAHIIDGRSEGML